MCALGTGVQTCALPIYWSAHGDPFAHVAERQPARTMTRGPAWQRAMATSNTVTRAPAPSERGPAASVGAKARSDLAIGMRVFHEKFGYGEIIDIDGNKLEVEFDKAGSKRMTDRFVTSGLSIIVIFFIFIFYY